MADLLLRVLLAPCLVVCASLVARRFGGRVGGAVAGLPVVAGPILLVLATEHGVGFAARAAVGVLVGVLPLAGFVVAYAAASRWVGGVGCLGVAYAAFGVGVWVLRSLVVGPGLAVTIALAALAAALTVLPRPPHGAATLPAIGRGDLLMRALCTAAAVVAVSAAASAMGPHLSGLVTAFPVVTAVLTGFTHAHHGRDEALRLLRGVSVGFFSFVAFTAVIAVAVVPWGVPLAFLIASGAAMGVQGACHMARRPRRIPSPKRPRTA